MLLKYLMSSGLIQFGRLLFLCKNFVIRDASMFLIDLDYYVVMEEIVTFMVMKDFINDL